MTVPAGEFIVLGRISGLLGVKGFVRVFSETDPRENILGYNPWYLRKGGQWRAYELLEGRAHGKGIVARLAGCEDRDQAAALLGSEIAIARAQLPAAGAGEYYWSDLIGLEVAGPGGVVLGCIDHLFETGANDVMVVRGERERLIPFNAQTVVAVDLAARRVQVDWDPEF